MIRFQMKGTLMIKVTLFSGFFEKNPLKTTTSIGILD